jgi:hypothetical protein
MLPAGDSKGAFVAALVERVHDASDEEARDEKLDRLFAGVAQISPSSMAKVAEKLTELDDTGAAANALGKVMDSVAEFKLSDAAKIANTIGTTLAEAPQFMVEFAKQASNTALASLITQLPREYASSIGGELITTAKQKSDFDAQNFVETLAEQSADSSTESVSTIKSILPQGLQASYGQKQVAAAAAAATPIASASANASTNTSTSSTAAPTPSSSPTSGSQTTTDGPNQISL